MTAARTAASRGPARRTMVLRAAAGVSVLALAAGVGACSSSDDSGDDGATAAAEATTADATPADLQSLLPAPDAFGEGFTVTPVTSAQLQATLDQVRTAAQKQVVDPAQCAATLDLTSGLDPASTAMLAADKQDQQTKFGVIVTRGQGGLDGVRTGIADCGDITVTSDETVSHLTTTPFAPAGATGQDAFGLTRVQQVGNQGQVTTILASEVVDGIAIRVMVNQPSAEALPPEVLDHYRQRATTLLNDTAGRAAQK